METRRAAIHRKMPTSPRQLPITGSAHKAGNGRRPLPAATGTARSARAAASREWLAEREAELLPVPYFHVVYTLPAQLRDIAYQNKAVVYDLLYQGRGRDHAHDRRRSRASRRPHRPHRRAAHLGLGDDPPSACAHDRAGRRPLGGRREVDLVPVRLPGARQCAGAPVPRQDAGDADRGACARPPAVSSVSTQALPTGAPSSASSARCRRTKWVVYCKAPFAGPEAVLRYLSRYTHRVAISNRRLARRRQ